jgi:hypothetical protein
MTNWTCDSEATEREGGRETERKRETERERESIKTFDKKKKRRAAIENSE